MAVSLSSTQIVGAWEAGDVAAERTVDCLVDLLASPLALVLNVVGASIVPVGGGLSNSPRLIARLDIAVRQRILRVTPEPDRRPRPMPGRAGPDRCGHSRIGGVQLMAQRILEVCVDDADGLPPPSRAAPTGSSSARRSIWAA